MREELSVSGNLLPAVPAIFVVDTRIEQWHHGLFVAVS
jgi:hypothetical protein